MNSAETRTASPQMLLQDVHLTLHSAAGPVKILRGVDLKVTQGEAVGIVGPSGSGKSTMLAVLAGLERPTNGTVTMNAQNLGDMSEDKLAEFRRSHVGIVFQSFHLIPTMTAIENVAVPLELAGRRDAFAIAQKGLEAVGLQHRLDHYPAQLSGGEQQRVAVARAFSTSPDVVLADEPTGNLDGTTGQAIMDLLFEQRSQQGTTLVLITHDPSLAARCDRIIRIGDGKIVEQSTPEAQNLRPVAHSASS